MNHKAYDKNPVIVYFSWSVNRKKFSTNYAIHFWVVICKTCWFQISLFLSWKAYNYIFEIHTSFICIGFSFFFKFIVVQYLVL